MFEINFDKVFLENPIKEVYEKVFKIFLKFIEEKIKISKALKLLWLKFHAKFSIFLFSLNGLNYAKIVVWLSKNPHAYPKWYMIVWGPSS